MVILKLTRTLLLELDLSKDLRWKIPLGINGLREDHFSERFNGNFDRVVFEIVSVPLKRTISDYLVCNMMILLSAKYIF